MRIFDSVFRRLMTASLRVRLREPDALPTLSTPIPGRKYGGIRQWPIDSGPEVYEARKALLDHRIELNVTWRI